MPWSCGSGRDDGVRGVVHDLRAARAREPVLAPSRLRTAAVAIRVRGQSELKAIPSSANSSAIPRVHRVIPDLASECRDRPRGVRLAGYRPYKTALKNPDFAAIGTAAGATGIRIEDAGGVGDGLREALATEGPVVVDVLTDPNALSMPPMITGEQVSGFAPSR